jgi:hypothetical protein
MAIVLDLEVLRTAVTKLSNDVRNLSASIDRLLDQSKLDTNVGK